MMHLQATGQHKKKAGLTFSSILPICINTHGQYKTPTCPTCTYKILQIFLRVFKFALAEYCVKFAKINAPQILRCLQYSIPSPNPIPPPHPPTPPRTIYNPLRSCHDRVDKIIDFYIGGPQFESQSGSSALGKDTLYSLPSPLERT